MKELFGKSKEIMNIRTLSLILNVVLDYLAIKLNYGVAGVAWATVIIEIVNMIMIMCLSKATVKYKVDREFLKELIELCKYGIVDRIFDRGGKIVLNIILSRLGTFEYAAHVILNQVEDFANDFCYGFGIGITTSIGITIGKDDKKEMEKLRKVINKITTILAIIAPTIIFIILITCLPTLLKEPEPLLIAYQLVPLVTIYAILMPIRYKYSSIMSGMKELKFIAKVSGITNIIKILLAYVLCEFFSISGAWITFSITYITIILILTDCPEANSRNIKSILYTATVPLKKKHGWILSAKILYCHITRDWTAVVFRFTKRECPKKSV